MAIGFLTQDTLSVSLSFLSVRDLGKCAQVNKQFLSALSESAFVWKSVAHRIYGKALADSTIGEYSGIWKEMVKDDNRRGACPTLYNIGTCAWRENGFIIPQLGANYYYCTISCIKWDRKNRIVRVYIDVRGENDLREPVTSGIRLSAHNGCPQMDNSARRFVSEMEEERRGHRKGYLVYDERSFEPPSCWNDTRAFWAELSSTSSDFGEFDGFCSFCYANLMQGEFADYEPVKVFNFAKGDKLQDVFKNEDGCFEYSSFRSPYADDTKLEEEQRFGFVPSAVLKRKFPRKWWV